MKESLTPDFGRPFPLFPETVELTPPKATPDPWDAFRHQMPVTRRWAYFDHAAVAPLPQPTVDAMGDWAADAAENGDANWSRWQRRVEEARTRGARLLGAAEEEIALVRNTTEGVTIVAEGFPWRQGDNVVIPSCEFPSNRFPWLNLSSRGVEARIVPCRNGRVEFDAVASACNRRTRVVAISWVDYAAGWRNDVAALAEIAHQHGAYLFLDAIQGLGLFSLDVKADGVDFLAADGHKWLLGPEGAGLFYLRREHLDLLRPFGLGWNSAEHVAEFSNVGMHIKDSAARYEGGSYPVSGFVGLAASLKLLSQFPAPTIADRILAITDAACERLKSIGAIIISDRDGARRSGIVAFDLPGKNPSEVRQQCKSQDVILNCRDGRLRISPHVYNNEEDINRLIAALVE